MSSGRFAHYVIQRNDTINDGIFHMSGGMQGVYSKMLDVWSNQNPRLDMNHAVPLWHFDLSGRPDFLVSLSFAFWFPIS